MSSPIQSLAMNDEQLKAFAQAYKQVEERARRGEITDKASIEKALQVELNKTFPSGYPVPTITVYSDKNTAVGGFYTRETNELAINLAAPAEISASTIIHEREHAVQAKKVSDGIAADLADKNIPVTKENILAASKASAKVGEVNAKGEPVLDASGKQKQILVTVSVSPAVAEQAAKDYNSGKRLSTTQREESKKLRKAGYSTEGIIKRDGLLKASFNAKRTELKDKQSYILAKNKYDKANIPGAPKEKLKELKKVLDNAEKQYKKSVDVYNSTVNNYRNNLLEESQAYSVGDRFIKVWRGLEKTRASVGQNQSVTTNESTAKQVYVASSATTNQANIQSIDKNKLQAQSEQVYSKTLAMAPKDLTLTNDQRVAKALIAANFDTATVAAVIENGSPKTKDMEESAKGDYAQGVVKAAEVNKESEANKLASASKSADQGIQV
jgi:hypothetical protein